jgi:hypothetical protein
LAALLAPPFFGIAVGFLATSFVDLLAAFFQPRFFLRFLRGSPAGALAFFIEVLFADGLPEFGVFVAPRMGRESGFLFILGGHGSDVLDDSGT